MNVEIFLYAWAFLALLLFVHEFAHLLAAIFVNEPVDSFSIGVSIFPYIQFYIKEIKVTISPLVFLGGVGLKNYDSLTPIKDIFISFAGPLSNILIGWILLRIFEGDETALNIIRDGQTFYQLGHLSVIDTIRIWAIWNLLIAVFNLLPLLPMDGGIIFFGIIQLVFKPGENLMLVMKTVSSILFWGLIISQFWL